MSVPTRTGKIYDSILFALIALEVAFTFYFDQEWTNKPANSICLFATSMLMGIVLLVKFYGKEVSTQSAETTNKKTRFFKLIPAAGLFATLWIFIATANALFLKLPIDSTSSDIIPTIEYQVSRWLTNQNVYAPINEWGYFLQPSYLPMQWMPFTVAELFDFDYRWVGVGVFVLGVLVLFFKRLKAQHPAGQSAVVILLAFCLYLMNLNDTDILALTVELLIAGYYILFITGLDQRNPYLKALCIMACLLSRYMLVLWLPLWFLTELINGDRKKLFITCAGIVACVVFLYVFPFLSKDWALFSKGYSTYSRAALGEWDHFAINNPQHVPIHLYKGHGFAWMFYEKYTYSLFDRIRRLQKFHILFSIGITILMGGWYLLKRKMIDYRIFLLASFKIYLAVFLTFIQVPYTYLFITPLFVSIAIFGEQIRYRIVASKTT